MDQQIEQTPTCSFFTNKYNRLQNQDNLPSSAGLQLSPKFQAKIGLFISFFALAASFEVLLASSIGKSAFPNDSAVSDFLTKPLSKGHQHFTNGSIVGMVFFFLSLMILAYFINKLYRKLESSEQAYRPHGIKFFESKICVIKEKYGFKIREFYEKCAIDPTKKSLAVIVETGEEIRYVGIPYVQYTSNNWCGYVLQEEIDKLIDAGRLPKNCYYAHFIIMPIESCFNLQNDNLYAEGMMIS